MADKVTRSAACPYNLVIVPQDVEMSLVTFAPILTLIYGVLSIVGGAIGYQKAGSKVSFISGVVSGFLLLIGAYMMSGGYGPGPVLSGVVTLVLVCVFLVRLVKTRKFMPAGLMVAVGVANLVSIWAAVPAV